MMKQVFKVAWVMGMLLAGSWNHGYAVDKRDFLGLITGDPKSTAYRVGMDLSALVKRHDINLAVYPSHGAVENIHAVYQRSANHLGLVQTDVLAFVAKAGIDPRLKLMTNKIKWVYPLYNQEVHILGNAEVNDFGDLQGRRVAIGDVQSGTYLTSRLLFEVAGVKPLEMVEIAGGQALAALRGGRVDAMITVDGCPVECLSLDVSPVDGLHLVPVTHDSIRAYYPSTRIPGGTYAWQDSGVDTVSVKMVLVAYDFRNQYCHTIGKLAWLIRENLAWLQKHGHPKWHSVDLSETVSGSAPYPCVADYTPLPHQDQIDLPPVSAPNPVADAIQTVFHP